MSRNAKKNVSLFEGSNFSKKIKKIKIMTFFFVTFPNAGELNYLFEAESYWF